MIRLIFRDSRRTWFVKTQFQTPKLDHANATIISEGLGFIPAVT